MFFLCCSAPRCHAWLQLAPIHDPTKASRDERKFAGCAVEKACVLHARIDRLRASGQPGLCSRALLLARGGSIGQNGSRCMHYVPPLFIIRGSQLVIAVPVAQSRVVALSKPRHARRRRQFYKSARQHTLFLRSLARLPSSTHSLTSTSACATATAR